MIPPGKEGDKEPLRPTEGAYVDVVDYDGDGKLDLLVGGYAHWTPEERKLTEAEKNELKELDKKFTAIQKEQTEMFTAVAKEAKEDSEKQQKLYQELAKTEKYRRTYVEMRKLTERKQELHPGPSREAFVWFYRRM